MSVERHVLVVFPHPDDESFGAAGAITLHTQAGTPVTYLCGTLGEMGRNMGKPFFATRETLAQVRERELYDACAVLGIADLRRMHLRDKTIEFEDQQALAARIAGVIEEVQPTLMITHYPGHGVHPDHNALGAAAIRAVGMIARERRPVIHAHAITANREEALGPPDVVLDLTDVFAVKLAAIRAHRSQSEAMLAEMEKELAGDPDVRERWMRRWRKEMYWTYRV